MSLQELVLLAAHQADKVVRSDRTAHWHGRLSMPFHRLLSPRADIAELGGHGSDERDQIRCRDLIMGDVGRDDLGGHRGESDLLRSFSHWMFFQADGAGLQPPKTNLSYSAFRG
jgi:hypothetical protein